MTVWPLFLALAFVVLYANLSEWIAERVPYVHVILIPFGNKWIAATVLLVLLFVAYSSFWAPNAPGLRGRGVVKFVWYGTFVCWLLYVLLWVWLYASGGI